jgi:hypothetical protein
MNRPALLEKGPAADDLRHGHSLGELPGLLQFP